MDESRERAHYAWRKRLNGHIPAISARVFALRDEFYRGCGTHYGLERSLGKLISGLNDYETPLSIANILIEKVVCEMFLRDLIRAEFSARGWNFPDKHVPNNQ